MLRIRELFEEWSPLRLELGHVRAYRGADLVVHCTTTPAARAAQAAKTNRQYVSDLKKLEKEAPDRAQVV